MWLDSIRIDREALPRHERRLLIAIVVGLCVFGLTDVRRRARIDSAHPEVHKTDLTVFTGAGAAFYRDSEPYEYMNPRGWKYPYFPLLGMVLAPLSALDSQSQAVVWFAVSLLLGWGCWREATKTAAALGTSLSLRLSNSTANHWLAFSAIATVLLPVLDCLQRGQVGLLKVYLLMLGMRLVIESRSMKSVIFGSLALSLAIVVKLIPALPVAVTALAWFGMCVRTGWNRENILRGSWVPGGVSLGMFLFVIVIPGMLLGFAANARHLASFNDKVVSMAITLNPEGQVDRPHPLSNQSLSNAIYRAGNWWCHTFQGGVDDRRVDVPAGQHEPMPMDSQAVKQTVLALRICILLLLCAAALQQVRSGANLGLAAVFGLANAATLVVSPMSRQHYFLMLLPAVLFVPLWIQSRHSRWLAQIAASIPAALVILHYCFQQAAGRIGLLGLGMTAWCVAGCLLLIGLRERTSAQQLDPGAAPVTVATASLVEAA